MRTGVRRGVLMRVSSPLGVNSPVEERCVVVERARCRTGFDGATGRDSHAAGRCPGRISRADGKDRQELCGGAVAGRPRGPGGCGMLGDAVWGGSLSRQPVRFVAHESNCSFLWRVAGVQGVEVDFLLAELGDGQPGQQALRPHLAEVLLSGAAAGRLAQMLGVPSARLRWALPHLRAPHLLPGERARWEWPWEPLAHCLVPACGLCSAVRGGGWGEVWLVWPERWRICERHGRWVRILSGEGR